MKRVSARTPSDFYFHLREGGPYMMETLDDGISQSKELVNVHAHMRKSHSPGRYIHYDPVAYWWLGDNSDYDETSYEELRQEDTIVPEAYTPCLRYRTGMCSRMYRVSYMEIPLFAGYKIIIADRYEELISEAQARLT